MNKPLKQFNSNFFQNILSQLNDNSYIYNKRTYTKNQMIALANTSCEKIGVISKGQVKIVHTLDNGKNIIINILDKHDIFGELLIFSNNNVYPYNIIANNNCEIYFINKEVFLNIFKTNHEILEKFLYHISVSYMTLNKYIKLISQKTIVNKLAYFLINYKEINNENRVCYITTKTELADFLGIERQSLIRELNNLKTNNIIDFDLHSITVKDYNYLLKKID